ncbi:MAG: leucine-rich repeat domain-containing protein [Spirochaetes bacterium]|nr:leucine-rich repeat domain-containing protein [Spirochaetota bacterium]
MTTSIRDLYRKIKKELTLDHLKQITVDIIDAYKRRNFAHLKKYTPFLGLAGDIHTARLFSLLVMKFHPDRHSFILKQADDLFKKGDLSALRTFHDGYFFSIPAAPPAPDDDIDADEKYAFDEEDFGYRKQDLADMERYGESALDFGEEEHGFMEALHHLFAGGLDVIITESDLMSLEGALDLSDFDIVDLKGAEQCIYLNELNLSNNMIEKIGNLSALVDLYYLFLSNNQIENIAPLESLVHLKELDISFNNISDIRVLEKLDGLEYVNLLGNPISDYAVVDKLMKKGTIVVFDGNILT